MRLCEEKVKSGEVRGKSGKIGSDLLFANVRIRFAIRTYCLGHQQLLSNHPSVTAIRGKR